MIVHTKPIYLIGFMSIAASLALCFLTSIVIDFYSFSSVLVSCSTLLFVLIYTNVRNMSNIQIISEYILLSIIINITVVLFSYIINRAGLATVDSDLYKIDRIIGIDVRNIIAFIDQHRLLSVIMELSYSSMGPQLIFIPAFLAAAGYHARASHMLVSYLMICSISCLISMLFPAYGSMIHLNINASDLTNLSGFTGHDFRTSFDMARQSDVFMLSMDVASGVITFPSIHAGVAVLCGWAAWISKPARWPIVLLNVLMFLSAVPVGAHYAVDLVMGILVAMGSIWAARKFKKVWLPAYGSAVPKAQYAT